MNKEKEHVLEISKEDFVKYIAKDDWEGLESEILSNCYCVHCDREGMDAVIVDYEIFVNDLFDVVFRGKCKDCGGEIGRYVEVGEDYDYVRNIMRYLLRKFGEVDDKFKK